MHTLIEGCRCLCALTVLSLCAVSYAQPLEVPNASFESCNAGASAPEGWTLSGGLGAYRNEAADGTRYIELTGNGATHDCNYWRTDDLAFEPATLYQMNFKARRVSGSGGCATSGPVFCNRDLFEIDDCWKDCRSLFVTPSNPRTGDLWLRFGQWEVNGSVAYDDVRIVKAQAVYRSRDGLLLGEGERICDGRYTFHAPFDSLWTNHARPLARNNCFFNTTRWVFASGSEVVYRHSIGDLTQTGGSVDVGIGYYEQGTLVIEASVDGNAWETIGSLSERNQVSFAVPARLYPAREIWIRLATRAARDIAGDSDLGSFQLYDYSYSASLENAPADFRGATRYAAIEETDPRLEVQLTGFGDAIPGGDNTVTALVRNLTQSPIAAFPRMTIVGRAGRIHERVKQELRPGDNEIRLAYLVRSTGMNDAVFSLGKDIRFRASSTFEVSDLYTTDFGELMPDSTSDVGLWWASSGWKISATRPVPERRGSAIRIAAARNEAEAAQFVVRPSVPLHGFNAVPEPLSGPGGAVIPQDRITLSRVRYVDIERPTDKTGAVGLWPDPLPPFSAPINVPAATNQPVWVCVKVPKDIPCGIYKGSIQLSGDGYAAKVPLEVEIFDFALPDRMSCTTAFGFSLGTAFQYQGVAEPEHKRLLCDQYLRVLSDHHITPYDPAPLDDIVCTWPEIPPEPRTPGQIAALRPSFDWTAWDAAMEKAVREYHFNSFRLPSPGLGGGTFHARSEPELCGFAENTPEYQVLFNSYYQQIEAHLREKGWLDMGYTYWFDEPDPKDYEFVMNGFRKLKEAAPGIVRMLTEQVEPALVGGPNLWCPVSPEFAFDAAETRRAEDEKFWWYVCTGPKAPYVTLFIDHPGTEMRVWLWQTWQRKIDGILIWATNYWHSPEAYPDALQNPYEDPMSWTTGYSTPSGARLAWGNGDGRFLYPPEAAAAGNPPQPVLDPPVATIRLEMLRDGIEDYEYHTILKRLLAEKGATVPEKERQELAALLEVPAEVTSSMTEFTKDPGPIERRHEAIARAIVSLENRQANQ